MKNLAKRFWLYLTRNEQALIDKYLQECLRLRERVARQGTEISKLDCKVRQLATDMTLSHVRKMSRTGRSPTVRVSCQRLCNVSRKEQQ